MKLTDILFENSTSTYQYGCAMLYGRCESLFKIQDAIDPKDIYEETGDKTFGLEDEPHITLLYGLHDDEIQVKDIKTTISKYVFPTIINAEKISCFYNEKYDVLKMDIHSKILQEINSALKEFPYTTDFPKYKPHLTIGYLKKGLGKKYMETFKNVSVSFRPENVVYSKPSGEKIKIPIKFIKKEK